MKLKAILKILGKFLLLLIIPALLMIRFGLDSLLSIIAYMQFLLIWSQVEISMRQHASFLARFEPSFSISINCETLEREKPGKAPFTIFTSKTLVII